MAFRIYEYGINKVITKTGQNTVDEVIDHLRADAKLLETLQNLSYRKWSVIVGYHGDQNGDWDRSFSVDEMKNARLMGQLFPNVALREVDGLGRGLSDIEITQYAREGNVFFTWCDCDIKVAHVLGQKARLLNVGFNV